MSQPDFTTGKVFLSYERGRADEVRLLAEALKDGGVQVWQDVRDLGAERVMPEIRRELEHPDTVGAVLWVTPEAGYSEVVLGLEIPRSFERGREGGFFVLPVAAGGLPWQTVVAIGRKTRIVGKLDEWNIEDAADPMTTEAATRLARRVLRERFRQIHDALPAWDPLEIGLYARPDAHAGPGHHHLLDWRHRFDGQEARPGAWEEHLLPALYNLVYGVATRAPGRTIHARGLISLAAATALGEAFQEPRGVELGWWQDSGGRETLWSLGEKEEDSGFEARVEDGDPGSEDVALCLSVGEDVKPFLQASQDDLPSFRQRIFLERQGDYPHELTPGEAVHLARLTIRTLRDHLPFRRAHLFLAGPVGLAVLVGRLLDPIPEVQTYELVAGKYRPAALLRP
jgi:hypothetical protein